MPSPKKKLAAPRTRRTRSSTAPLLLIDNEPLHRDAWKKLRAAQKRLEKSTREMHRFENEDQPAFQRWLFSTFPLLLGELRELAQKFAAHSALIERVEHEAWATGSSPTEVWLRRKRREALGKDPDDFEADIPKRKKSAKKEAAWDDDFEEEFAREFGDIFRDHGLDPDYDEPPLRDFTQKPASDSSEGNASENAKAIYRRLVQRLHPDRGGEWTRKRELLWHEVQQAWSRQDADWLARIETELEVADDTLSVTSPLSRLLRALEEIEAARRNIARTLTHYRSTPQWKFSLKPPGITEKRIHGDALRAEAAGLRTQVLALERMIKGWERNAALAEKYKVTPPRRRAV